MSVLTKDLRKTLDENFKKREYRLIAYEMMEHWDHAPSIEEGKVVSEKYGVTSRNMRYVIRKLRDLELFTEEEGSIPLMRKTLREEESSRILRETPRMGEVGGTTRIAPPNTAPSPSGVEDSAVSNPLSPQNRGEVSAEEFNSMKQQFDMLSTRFNGVSKDLGDIKSFMAQISAAQTQAQKVEVNSYDLEADEDDIELTVNPSSPVSLPSLGGEYVGSVRANPGELIELEGQIIAIKSIGFTPKSMMLYDLSKAEGFAGNISDFCNACIYDAFKQRNIELTVVERRRLE